MRPATAARWLYLALLAWQSIWFAALPAPWGKGMPWLALLATLPLLLPLRGVWRGQSRALIWAGYLVLLYLTAGLVELWAAVGQRVPAAVQVLLAIAFLYCLALVTRKRR